MEYSIRFCSILILTVFPRIALSVPHEYCLDTFDDGDCGDPPTSVFYYYKPGSRCEIRTWRGCSTLNKFADHFTCSHFCIGRIWGDPIELPVLTDSAEIAEKEKVLKIVEAQFVWQEEIKELNVDEIKTLDKILDDVVEDVQHHQKLSLLGLDVNATDSDSSFSIIEEEVVVLP